MFSKAIIAAIAAATIVNAKQGRTHGVNYWWSTQIVQARMDPIISPGSPQSAHVHMIAGSNGFAVNMNDDTGSQGSCSGSLVAADRSNYWWPQLYFQDPKTKKFEDVKLAEFKAYYFFESTNDEIKPFPKGFRMVAGDPFLRSNPYKQAWSGNTVISADKEIQNVGFSCGRLDSASPFPRKADGSAQTEGTGFPDMKCNVQSSGLSSYIHFPSCADLSQPFENYANNTVWPTQHYNSDGSSHEDCPTGYTHLPHLFLEIKWDAYAFMDRWTDGIGQQPFVFANGDKTGFGAHADFIAGWDEDALAHIIATCDSDNVHGDGIDSCPGVTSAAKTHPETCSIQPPVPEKVTGVLDTLPGCNPIQAGPQAAVMCDCSSGTPVCNGKAAPDSGSTSPSKTGTSSAATKTSTLSSVATGSTATTVAAGASSATSSTIASASATMTDTAPVTTPSSTNNGNGNTQTGGEDGDEGEDDDDEDDNSCDVPEHTTTVKPKATPVPMTRRSLGQPLYHNHQHFHQRRTFNA